VPGGMGKPAAGGPAACAPVFFRLPGRRRKGRRRPLPVYRAGQRKPGDRGGLAVAVDHILTGGAPGSGASDIVEVIALENASREVLDLHLFPYVDLELRGDPRDGSGPSVRKKFGCCAAAVGGM
jgi:hypothetical protein